MNSASDSQLFESGHFVYTVHSVIPLEGRQSFEDFQSEMNEAALCFEGYRGQSISFQHKEDGRHLLATTRIVFEALDQCLHWLDSPQRRGLLHQAETLMDFRHRGALESDSFDQWIQMRQPKKVPIWKVNLLVWLALYPSVMSLTFLGSSSLGQLPLPLNMLMSNLITVLLTGHFLVPWLSRVYSPWLHSQSLRLVWLGTVSVFMMQLIFLGLFSSLPGMPWQGSVQRTLML